MTKYILPMQFKSFGFLANKQTNTLLSPGTIQCTRCQNIKQIHRNRRQ